MLTATYSADDNKLRLYATERLDTETYQRVKSAGFKWAPKQDLFVAPMWTPAREDLLLELCEEIEDEDYTPEERAADRAERFGGYRDKRRAEAGALADTFESGPRTFGHQSLARAERQAAKHDRFRRHAVSQWSKAEYWQMRTSAVIAHALHVADPRVRRGRIKRLEAEQRKHAKTCEEYAVKYNAWNKVLTLDGLDSPAIHVRTQDFIGISGDTTPAARFAYMLASGACGSCHGQYNHPRTGKESSLYSLMTDSQDPITAREAAELWLENASVPGDPDSYSTRWAQHYDLRLTYERAMLAAEGGSAADAEMEAGGWIGKHQIHAVNKSPATGKVVSVKLMAPKPWWNGEGEAPLTLQSFNIERLGESAYRAPTDEERARFAESTKAAKAAKKASTPKAPSLINPTDADAEKLQALWNAKAEMVFKKHNKYGEYKPSELARMTQAEYSAHSKGSYSNFETVEVCAHGYRARTQYGQNIDESPVVFKIRKRYGGTGFSHSADRVVVITDKPQKELPLNWESVASAKEVVTA